MVPDEIVDFVRQMKPKEHVVMLYSKPEDKRLVLFTYLKEGLARGEATAYVVGEETIDQIKEEMRKFGINVEGLENSGALHVMHSIQWYTNGGKLDVSRTKELWKKLYDKSLARGFKGLRVTGEGTFFFESRMANELVVYERSLHRELDLPMTAICAYNSETIAKENGVERVLDLIKSHRTVIILGQKSGVVDRH